MLATLLVTLLVSYDSNIHGAALLLVPGAIFLFTMPGAAPHMALLRLAFFLPGAVLPFALDLTGSLTGEAVLMTLLQVAILAVLLHSELIRTRRPLTAPQQTGEGLFRRAGDGDLPWRLRQKSPTPGGD